MDHDEFIGQVQHKAHLGSRGDAERATRATLQTLSERIVGGAAENLAAQLPPHIGGYLDGAAPVEDLSMDDFFERVAEREGVDLPESIHHARAVIEVLQEAVDPGQIAKILDQLPEEFDRLFESGSEGELRMERD